jgi:hypothetical protein
VTYNLPLKRIAAADLSTVPGGHGDIALALAPGDRIAWLQLWPHARPWRLAQPEPALRAVPDAAVVARRLTQAWSQATGQSPAPASTPVVSDGNRDRADRPPRTALQGR